MDKARPVGGRRRRSSPQNLRRGGRPKGGCASGPPSSEPRRVAFVRESDAAIDPPPNIRGTEVVRGEGVPPALPPPTLVPWPPSGRETRDRSSPQYSWCQSSGRRMRLRYSPAEPSRVASVIGRETPRSILPQIYSWWLSSGGERLRYSPRRPSSRGLCPGERRRDRSSSRYLRRGSRLGGGCASGTPPADPRPVAFVREGEAAFDRPPP